MLDAPGFLFGSNPHARGQIGQLMDHLPWKTFGRIVVRYGGDHRVRDFSCANQFRCMAFAQLTYRESLRDIDTCLCRSRPSSTTWAFEDRWRAVRWPSGS